MTPGFFDLDALVQGADFTAASRDDGGFGARRIALDLGRTPVPTGVAMLPAAENATGRHPANEFVLVMRGRLVLRSAAGALERGPGDAVVIPQGAAYDWSAAADTAFAFQTYACPASAGTVPVPVARDPEMASSAPPSASLLTTPVPTCRGHLDHLSGDGAWKVGTWESTPYGRRAITYGHDELMHVLDGVVTITDAAGRVGTFGAGATFMVPRGAACAWDNAVPVRKIYVIHRPKA